MAVAILRAALLVGLAAGSARAAAPPQPAFLRQQWLAQAAAGDAQAAYHLGLMYDLGQGVTANAATALDWYRRAGAGGVGEAAFNVAVMLDDGQSVRRDRVQAAIWYARAAVHGDSRAALNLARLYEAGDGVPHNEAAALAWLEMAAPHIPIARQRLRVLRAQVGSVAPAAPDAMPPVAQPAANPAVRPAELVWTAPATAGAPLRYVVSLAVPPTQTSGVPASGVKAWTPVWEQATALTAVLPPPAPGACYAWRVYSLLPGGAHYAASAWQSVGCSA